MKRIIAFMLCLGFIFSLTGCMRQTPETAIKNYFKEIQETVTTVLEIEVEDERTATIVDKMFEKFDYDIIKLQETDNENSVIAYIRITNINSGKAIADTITEYFAYCLTVMFNQPSDEEMKAKFYEILMNKLTTAEMLTADIEIPMHYINDKWEISIDKKTADTIIGGFTTYMDDSLFN